MVHHDTDDLRIAGLAPLLPPAILLEELPASDAATTTVYEARRAIARCLRGEDDRLVVIVGPCSIHDPAAALEYAARLKEQAGPLASELLLVMRVYFEKPRTTVGWKGLINDPALDGSFRINQGLRLARKLLRDLAEAGIATGTEFLDTISPQFLADLVGWGAIGARTTECQLHRELASGLSMPVGFKNGTRGGAQGVQLAVDAVLAASHPHRFLSVTKQGLAAIVATRGNDSCHLILRGGSDGPNYSAADLAAAATQAGKAGVNSRIMVDCSHGNSQKDHRRQVAVAQDLAAQLAAGNRSLFGLMLESHLHEGRQDLKDPAGLAYGTSITDACLGWTQTVPVLDELARAVAARRRV